MKKLISEVLTHLQRGEAVVLCSILASSGSSPRGAGAKMAVFADGSAIGTIGGGAVEKIATEQALDVLKSGKAHLKAFTLRPNQVNDIGMICGGDVTVYYQYFSPNDVSVMKTLQKLRSLLDEDCNVWLLMKLEEGEVTEFSVYRESELPDERRALFASRAVLTKQESIYYTEPVARQGRTYIFGGGHVGKALCQVLAATDFRVTIFDNRPDYALQENFPGAERVILGDYRSIGEKVQLHKDDYVIIMTPGHQADFEVLEQTLRICPSYVGCIGSRGKIAKTNERLLQAGVSQAAIDTVHAPIGLPILAETPAEIAVSVAAELIRHRKEHL